MKYLPLLWAAVWRRPAETLLTWFAATAAFTLFGLMTSVRDHAQYLIDAFRMDRLWVVMRFPDSHGTGLPIALAGKIARTPGVIGVGTVHWLDGYHGDPRDPASVMAVDEGMPRGYPELPMSSADWRRLFSMPDGVFASRKAARKWNLHEGDTFQVTRPREPQADGNTTRVFQVLGIIGDIPDRDEGFLLGNYHYIDNSEPVEKRGLGNMFIVAIADAGRAGQVCRAIDQKFLNSTTPTYCVPTKLAAQAVANSSVDMASITLAVAGAGLFMVLFLVANGIARSVSERIPEFAVLETVGFRERHLATLVVLEAAVPCVLGAALGTALAFCVSRYSAHLPAGDLTRLLSTPEFPPTVLASSFGFAILLAIGSSIVPVLRLRKLSVIDALAGR